MTRSGLLVVSVLVMSLAGCTSLPNSGDPQAFIIEAPAEEPIGQSAFGPRFDSEPNQLVSDFLRACAAGTSDNYATARQYLLPNVANSWDPSIGVLIYPTDKTPAAEVSKGTETSTRVTLQAQVRAALDEQGIFSAADDSEAQVVFSLEKNAQGQWRISDLEDGILLSQSQFESVFQQAQLYFLATDRESLVQDPRWYPKTRLASHLIDGLIAGPSATIAPAVHSALEPNLWMPTQGVEIEDGTVRVDLMGDPQEGDSARELISLQINATFSQLSNISDVQIRLNSIAIPNAEVPSSNRAILDSAAGLRSGTLVVNEGQSWSRVISAEDMGEQASLPVGSPVQSDLFAWLGENGALKIKDGAAPVKEHEVRATSAPVIDRWGWTWVITAETPGELTAVDVDGTVVSIPLEDGKTDSISDFVISPDGVRAAYLKKTESGNTAYQVVVLRKDDGTPRAFDQIGALPDAGTNIRDISWAGANDILTLEATPDGDRMVTVPVSGFVETGTLPSDSVIRITGGSSPAHVFVQTQDQTLYMRVGTMWRRLDSTIADVRYPG